MELLTTFPEVKDYSYVSTITNGAFKGAWKAMNKITQDTFAIKSISKSNVAATQLLKEFSNELYVIRKADHKYIDGFIELIEDTTTYHLVFEYPEGVCLREYVEQNGSISIEAARNLLSNLLSVVYYLQKDLSFKYSTINADNVYVDSKCELTRFYLQNEISVLVPNPDPSSYAFVPPEIFTTQKSTNNSDSWSIGVLLCLIMSAKLPFDGTTKDDFIKGVLSGHPNLEGLPAPVGALVTKCLTKNPMMRATLADVCASELLHGVPLSFDSFLERRNSESDSQSRSPRPSPSPRTSIEHLSVRKLPSATSLAGIASGDSTPRKPAVRIGVRKALTTATKRPTTRTPPPNTFS